MAEAKVKSERSPYLIGKAMKYYLIASILSTIVIQLNVIVDGIIVGHYVSPDALSAVNLYSPISLAIASLCSLFGTGATVLAARSIGERDVARTGRLLSTALTTLLVLGIVFAAVFFIFQDAILNIICKEERLQGYFLNYMLIMGGFGLTAMLSSFLGLTVEVDGNPRLVTIAQSVGAGTNIVFDLILVGLMGCGIEGAAFASVAASIVTICMLCRYLFSRRCSFRLRIFSSFSTKALIENIQQGLPLIAGNVILMLLIFFLNSLIQDMQGADGMFALSVCISLLTIGMLFGSGIGSMLLSVGGFLNGQKDFVGLRIMVNRSIGVLLVLALIVTLTVEICPDVFASAYGADTPELIAYTGSSLRLFILALPMFLIIISMANLYQMLGYLVLAPVMVALLPGLLFPGIFICASLAGPENVWYAFPLAGVSVISVVVVTTEAIRMRKHNVTHFTLIPSSSSECLYNVSMENSIESMSSHLNTLRETLHRHGIDAGIIFDISLCAEEIILNIIQHAYKDKARYYIDVMAITNDDRITVSVKDDGKPYNPLTQSREKRGVGLALVNDACSEMDYKYMYGQNMVYFTWKIKGNQEKNKNCKNNI